MSDTIGNLFKSRKFLVLFYDSIISTITLLLTLYASPDNKEIVLAFIGLWQPVVMMYIYAVAKEDSALKASGNFIHKY